MSNGDRNDLLRLGGQCPIGEDRLAERVESRLLIGRELSPPVCDFGCGRRIDEVIEFSVIFAPLTLQQGRGCFRDSRYRCPIYYRPDISPYDTTSLPIHRCFDFDQTERAMFKSVALRVRLRRAIQMALPGPTHLETLSLLPDAAQHRRPRKRLPMCASITEPVAHVRTRHIV